MAPRSSDAMNGTRDRHSKDSPSIVVYASSVGGGRKLSVDTKRPGPVKNSAR